MDKPILFIDAFTDKTAKDFISQLIERDSNKDVTIWLDSGGGSVTAGYSMLGVLNDWKGKVTTRVVGMAASMGLNFLLYSDIVEAFDTSIFMLHKATVDIDKKKLTDDQITRIRNTNIKLREKLEERIDPEKFKAVSGKSFDEVFAEESRIDVSLTASQAHEIGLVDKVIELDVKKKREIEMRYYNDIAALSTIDIINENNNKMENPFKKKTPLKIVELGELKLSFRELKAGAEIEIVGKEDLYTGSFEKDGNTIHADKGIITTVEAISVESKAITALKAEIDGLKGMEKKVTDEVVKVMATAAKRIETLETNIEALTKIITEAKLSVGNPALPKGEFQDDKKIVDAPLSAYQMQKKIDAQVELKRNGGKS